MAPNCNLILRRRRTTTHQSSLQQPPTSLSYHSHQSQQSTSSSVTATTTVATTTTTATNGTTMTETPTETSSSHHVPTSTEPSPTTILRRHTQTPGSASSTGRPPHDHCRDRSTMSSGGSNIKGGRHTLDRNPQYPSTSNSNSNRRVVSNIQMFVERPMSRKKQPSATSSALVPGTIATTTATATTGYNGGEGVANTACPKKRCGHTHGAMMTPILVPRIGPGLHVWTFQRWVDMYGHYIDEMVAYIIARMPTQSPNERYYLVWNSDRLWMRLAYMLHRTSCNRRRSYVVIS